MTAVAIGISTPNVPQLVPVEKEIKQAIIKKISQMCGLIYY